MIFTRSEVAAILVECYPVNIKYEKAVVVAMRDAMFNTCLINPGLPTQVDLYEAY